MTENEHPNNNEKNSDDNEKKPINSSLNINKASQESNKFNKGSKNSNNPSKKEKTISFERRWFGLIIQDFIQIILAALTFFTLLCFIYFSHKQFIQTKQAINRADTANFYTKQSLIYTSKSIDLSNRTLMHTITSDSINDVAAKQDFLTRERNVETELRAYCVLSPTVAFFDISDSTRPGIVFKIKNVGKTPAYDVSIYIMLTVSDKIPFHKLLDVPNIESLIIGSGDETAEQKFIANFSLNKQYFENIKIGKQFLFFIGKVTYKDIFGKNRFLYFGSVYDFTTKIPYAIPGFVNAN